MKIRYKINNNCGSQDKSSFDAKQKQMSEVEDIFTKMKNEEQKDQEAFAAAQKKYQAVSSGLFSNDQDGGEATLQDQLMRELLSISLIIFRKSFYLFIYTNMCRGQRCYFKS